MTRIISPDHFAREFHAVVSGREKQIASLWTTARDYTSLFTDPKTGILLEVSERLSLRYANPWWTLDAIFYEGADVENFPVAWRMAKHICVAIEHENNIGWSHYEINKLSLFNAPLKVLISYPGREPGTRGESVVLARYASILRDADIFSDFHETRRQLVAFAKRSKDGIISWRYHKYDKHGFSELSP
jgi:hypothetical protein